METITRGRDDAGDPDTTGRWLEISRRFDAPRALVFAAFAEDRHLRRWCCPEGFSVTDGAGDFREGGAWRAEMRGPDGASHRMAGEYLAIEPGVRIRQSHRWVEADGSSGPERVIEIGFADDGAGTRLSFRMGPFDTEANRDGHREGWGQSLDHLDAYLPEALDADPAPAGEPVIRLSRLLAHPPARVFAAWSDPRHLGRWWGPEGFTTTTTAFGFSEGGVWRFVMHGPDGTDYPNRIEFVTIDPPRRIAYRHRGEDAAEDAIFDTEVTFAPVGDGTRITLAMRFASVAVRDHVAQTFGAVEGGGQTLARLADLLDRADQSDISEN